MSLTYPSGRWWMVAGGLGLSGTAGYVNAVALLGFGLPVSHMTGNLSHLSIEGEPGDVFSPWLLGGMLVSFVAGAAVSSYMIRDVHLRPGRRYGLCLMVEACILGVAGWASGHAEACLLLTALACGMQNSMASLYYGLIIRTTHMTGVLTDLGIKLGVLMRGRRVEVWRLSLLSGLVAGYALGGGLATWLVALPGWSIGLLLGLSGLITGLAGLVYCIWRTRAINRSSVDLL